MKLGWTRNDMPTHDKLQPCLLMLHTRVLCSLCQSVRVHVRLCVRVYVLWNKLSKNRTPGSQDLTDRLGWTNNERIIRARERDNLTC